MINWKFIREVGPFRWLIRYSSLQFRKRILKSDTSLRLPTGLRINLPRQSKTSTEIYVTSANMDWGAEAIFAKFADSKRDFLDIGSHIGYYATYLAPRVRKSYAFEPDPRNHPGLYSNARLSKNIEVFEMAVSSHDGIADFFVGQSSSVGSLNEVGGVSVRVPTIKIDTFVTRHAGIDVGLIKTDIEGHDLEALLGMEATVATFQPLILTECSWKTDLSDLCARWSYSVFAVSRNFRTRRTKFLELNVNRPAECLKMLFLVPPVLRAAFNRMKEGVTMNLH